MTTQLPSNEPRNSRRTAPKVLPDIIETASKPAARAPVSPGPTLVARLRAIWDAQKGTAKAGGMDRGLLILGAVVVAVAAVGYFGLL